MTRARDVANVLSTATSLATDTETAAAISSHNTAANGHTTRGNTAGRPATPTTGDVYINTETGFAEIYTGATYGWEQVGAVASAPTSVVATNNGSSRAYNNGSASVAFSAGTIAGRTYTITSSPGSYTSTGSSSPLVVTGLQSNTQYTYTVTATNNYGTSSASSASSAVTATTVPQAPTIGTATAGDESATLTFTEGATGGSSITNYKYSTNASTYTAFSPAQTSSPLTISGLTNGTLYSFYLKAVNANGDSSASGQSNSVTPILNVSYESIATITNNNTQTITFSNIPQTYKHLQLRIIARTSVNSYSFSGFAMRVGNGSVDSASNYSYHRMYTSGNNIVLADSSANYNALGDVFFTANSAIANSFAVSIIDIIDYNNTNKYKTSQHLTAFDNNTTGTDNWSSTSKAGISFGSGNWRSTSAINTISLILGGSGTTINTNSHFALYGIKGA